MRRSMILLSALLFTGCASWTPEQRENFANALAAFGQGMQTEQAAQYAVPLPVPSKLMIFGGEGHKTYLGCLNCSEYALDSVQNAYGNFGSAYSNVSMSNQFSEFGSMFATYSACNPYALDPPVIVDSAGNFYGRLTMNAFNPQRTNDQEVLQWLANRVCSH